MRLSIGEAASLLNTSVRTLRYYDEIGLAGPSEISESGYRYYDEKALSKLQQIIFYRELELSLKEIANIFNNPQYDEKDALKKHRKLLRMKQEHLDELIKLLDNLIGGKNMSDIKITADDIESIKRLYADEARQRFGNTREYAESEKKQYEMTAGEKADMFGDMNVIFAEFAKIIDKEPSCQEAQRLVKRWQEHITKFYYNCTKDVLSSLGQMYVEDERFKNNIDRYGEGTAEFISRAISKYCAEQY